MVIATIFVLCSFVVGITPVTFKADVPFVSVPLSEVAILDCCYTGKDVTGTPAWVFQHSHRVMVPIRVNASDLVTITTTTKSDALCGVLTLEDVQLNDSGLYRCLLTTIDNKTRILSHGTYLQVYKPLEKTLNFSESTKNGILTAEGILLLLCVVLPSATLLCKSKKVHEIEKKKMKKEEENIYQGLNLDDCCTTYDQIERSQALGPYQDVCNIMEEEEEIQLEKP
ncbi:B-cell antigen receptor complex-associated protein alpha chain [Lates japonicus]